MSRAVQAALVVLTAVAPASAASIAVTTTAESPGVPGDCTLGEAIEAANLDIAVDACAAGSGADTITLPPGTYTLAATQTTPAGRSAFVVRSAVTIVGPGAALSRSAAASELRFFEVTAEGDLTLDGLTVIGGVVRGTAGVAAPGSPPGGHAEGGAIRNAGRLTLRDVTLRRNGALGGRGANQATGSPPGAGGAGRGGAVYNAGTFFALRTRVIDNLAVGGTGGRGVQDPFSSVGGAGGAGEGGGAYNAVGGVVESTDTDWTGNTATGGPAGFCQGPTPDVCFSSPGSGLGGAVYSGGALTAHGGVFHANQARGASGAANAAGAGLGGAVRSEGGRLDLTGAVVIRNRAVGGQSSFGGRGSGGGLSVNGTDVRVTASAIAHNEARYGRTHVALEARPGPGGGVFASGSTLALGNSTVGGNVGNDGAGLRAEGGTVSLTHTTVADNVADDGAAGVAATGAPVALTATIVANNLGGTGNCAGAFTDGRDNLQYPGTSCGTAIPVADPLLGPRQREDGSRTVFHPLESGSPARDSADTTTCPPSDQRGVSRPLDGDGDGVAVCDAGAIEASAPRPPPADLIFRDGFDGATWPGWSGASTAGGELTVSRTAALDGTQNGLAVRVTGTAGVYLQDDTPAAESRYRVRLYLDPNGFDPGSLYFHNRVRVLVASQEPQRRVMALVLRWDLSTGYALMVRARQDDGTQADTGFVSIARRPHAIEVDWQRASAPGASDGRVRLWIDGVLVARAMDVANGSSAVDSVRLGAMGVKPSAGGTLHFDAFESRRLTRIHP